MSAAEIIATESTAEEIARLRAENEALWRLVEHLRQDTSAGFSRGRVRASYHEGPPPIFGDFGFQPLDI